jgi:hypothetical protein
MSRLNINIGDSANDRTGDPLRTAFDKVNQNFVELYARTGDDIQIPALAGNDGRVLTTNGTTLSWSNVNTTIDRLVNGTSTVILGTDGVLTLPETGTIRNPSIVGNSTGTIYTFNTDVSSTTPNLLSASFIDLSIGGNADNILAGWFITFHDGTQKLVTASSLENEGTVRRIGWFGAYTSTDVWPLTVQSADYVAGTTTSTLEISPDGTTTWTFDADGTLTLPNGATQQSTGSINCQAGEDTIVFTSSQAGIHTIKLLLKVEGVEDPGVTNVADTQSCEMIVAKGFRGPTVAASVYGIVYTSVEPLATFTAQWNAVTSRVEVTCRPTSLTNNVDVKSFATEITTSD